MKRDDTDPASDTPPTEPVALALAQIEASAAFRGSRRHRALLRHLVERTLGGEPATLKESLLAVEVFGRAPGRFDPRQDSIVRVETRRLRKRLDEYYRAEGRESPLRIELPVGSYVPLLARREAPRHPADATRRARDLVERGEHFLRQPLSAQTLAQALSRFDAALRESPDHAPALVGAGRAWFNLAVGWYRAPREAADHAAEALQRALDLEPDHAVALTLLGAIEHQFRHDWPAAVRRFRRAAALAPELAFVHSAWGCHLVARGEFEAAEAALARSRALDPLYLNTRMHLVNLRLGQGRLNDAQAELDAALDLAPESLGLVGLAGVLALERGQPQAAIEHYRRAGALAPGHPGCIAGLAAALASAGRLDEADALMQPLQDGGAPLSPYMRAVVAARCGRTDAAYALLGQAIAEADPNAMLIAADTSLRSLRGDARWPALVAALRRPLRD
ncbi:MAG: tetratricopeptide repeat protein [Burkholderiales bacterium]|nr:tetratricopeptide repeat protein [Burkholderiales bacterium]